MDSRKSDGCTMPKFFKKIMKAEENRKCCEQHDFDRRNKNISKSVADKSLRECIAKTHPVLAWVYYIAVVLARPFYRN